jgi:hypothetical protein
MADPTNEQRIAKIEELMQKISPLNYERIFLETGLHFLKEKYFKSYDEKEKSAIIESENKLTEINKQLSPLFAELRKHQVQYFVQYESETSFTNEQKSLETQREFLFLKNDCNIETTVNGWEPYINDTTVNQLLMELQQFLFNHRFSNFNIRHIKRL